MFASVSQCPQFSKTRGVGGMGGWCKGAFFSIKQHITVIVSLAYSVLLHERVQQRQVRDKETVSVV